MPVGSPPLLGLRWAPTATRSVPRHLARADREGSPARRRTLDPSRTPPQSGRAVDPSRTPPHRDLAQWHEESRRKDKQIRWLKELALEAADEEPSARPPVAESDSVRRRRALTHWRVESARAARAKLELALREADARCEQLQVERESLALEVTHEAGAVHTLLELRADAWRLASATRAWRALARDGLARGRIGRRAERARLRRGMRELAGAVLLADEGAASAARSEATLRRSRLRAALMQLRAHAAAAARARAERARGARLRARGAQRTVIRTLDLAVRRAAKDGVALVRAEADALNDQLASCNSLLQAHADAQLAHAARRDELAQWRRDATARLRAADALISSAGVEALLDALDATPAADGAAPRAGASALALCATTIDELRVRLAGAEAALVAERALGATAVQRQLRDRALAELRVQAHAADAIHAHALRQAIERYARAHEARWREREAQLGRASAWRAAHAAELFEGAIAVAMRRCNDDEF